MARRTNSGILDIYIDICRKTPWWVGLAVVACGTALFKWVLPAMFPPPVNKGDVSGVVASAFATGISSVSWWVGLVLLMGWLAAQLKKPAVKGAIGEAVTSTIHKLALDSQVYHQLNNVTLRIADGTTTQIDHVIISQFGIFVVETKHMSGWIFGQANQAQWTQSFPNGDRFQFQNPIHQNHRHVMALIEFFGLSKDDIDRRIFNLVNFGPDAVLKTADALPPNVTMPHLAFIRGRRTQVFTPDEACTFAKGLQRGRMPTGFFKTQQTHERHLASLQERHQGNKCPKCARPLVERRRKSDGQAFFGCSGFPSCRYIRS